MEKDISLTMDTVAWLLEKKDPDVRAMALRYLLGRSADDPEYLESLHQAHRHGPIAQILEAMQPEGYWVRPGAGYNPKYRSTVWSVILLAQLGANINADERVKVACSYLMDHMANGGQFSTQSVGSPSGTVDCLQGNLLWALLQLGYEDERLAKAIDWLARSQTGDGIAPKEDRTSTLRYYAYKSGPDFQCGVNERQPCAWGAVKVMLALGMLPAKLQTEQTERAKKFGLEFLLGRDPSEAKYPTTNNQKPSRNWWKFGFPVFYITDLLQLVQAAQDCGAGTDPRLANALDVIQQKQSADGRWILEFDYSGKTWCDFGEKKKPNKYVTLRALRVLKNASNNLNSSRNT